MSSSGLLKRQNLISCGGVALLTSGMAIHNDRQEEGRAVVLSGLHLGFSSSAWSETVCIHITIKELLPVVLLLPHGDPSGRTNQSYAAATPLQQSIHLTQELAQTPMQWPFCSAYKPLILLSM